MKAMLLAAGRGERMRPLTDRTPKPLIPVAGKPLIVYLIQGLVTAGFNEIVVNHAHLGEQIERALGNGQRFGATIYYSPEGSSALETGGGILNALPLLKDGHFLVVNSDIWTDYPFEQLKRDFTNPAHLVLVDNPLHQPAGDFTLNEGKVHNQAIAPGRRLTFSGIGVYSAELFSDCALTKFPLTPVLRAAADRGRVSGELYCGEWMDVGTPERRRDLEERLRNYPK